MQLTIMLKQMIVVLLTFCVLKVLSTDTKKEPRSLERTLQNSYLHHIILDFLLPYESELLVKPLNTFIYTKMNTDLTFRTKFHTFMFEQIMKLPVEKEHCTSENLEIFTMVTKFIRFNTDDFRPDIESIRENKIKARFIQSKNNHLLENIEDSETEKNTLHFSFTDQKFWFQKMYVCRMPRYPVCFLITDRKSNLYLLRMSDVAGIDTNLISENQMADVNDIENNSWIQKNQGIALRMRLRKYNTKSIYSYVMPMDVFNLVEEFVTIEFNTITGQFKLREDRHFSLLQTLYWEDDVNQIHRTKLASCIATKNSMLNSSGSKIILSVSGFVFASLYYYAKY